ncbi:MAG: hypothetical protein JW384_00982 [Nitrosomonadaceae bacterium]|nr:hypothetical protein [Nitrosomonadaceae bacterium]
MERLPDSGKILALIKSGANDFFHNLPRQRAVVIEANNRVHDLGVRHVVDVLCTGTAQQRVQHLKAFAFWETGKLSQQFGIALMFMASSDFSRKPRYPRVPLVPLLVSHPRKQQHNEGHDPIAKHTRPHNRAQGAEQE